MIDAAADAGFDGISIWTAHHDWAVADGMSSQDYVDYHHERGLAVPAAEVVLEWPPDNTSIHVLDVAARVGASYVIAVSPGPVLPIPTAAASLAALCDLASERGLAISLEFLPFGGVPGLASAVRLLEATNRDNLGLVIDTWHWFRQPGGPDVVTLRRIPPERIHVVQLDDAPSKPAGDLARETMTARLLPGEGAIEIAGMLAVLAEMGAQPIVVSEVFSATLSALPAGENARRQFVAATAVLGRQPPA